MKGTAKNLIDNLTSRTNIERFNELLLLFLIMLSIEEEIETATEEGIKPEATSEVQETNEQQ